MSKLDGLRWRLSTIVARPLLRCRGIQVGSRVRFDGLPIVTGSEFGAISIGDGVELTGCSRGTALGVRSRVILRLMCPGARLSIGAETALSGTVICSAISVEIGERVLIGADVLIFDTDFHNLEPESRHAPPDWARISKRVVIEDDVFIGARSIVMKGVSIGKGAIIGAGSVVTADVPPFMTAAGSPVRILGSVPRGHDRESLVGLLNRVKP